MNERELHEKMWDDVAEILYIIHKADKDGILIECLPQIQLAIDVREQQIKMLEALRPECPCYKPKEQ